MFGNPIGNMTSIITLPGSSSSSWIAHSHSIEGIDLRTDQSILSCPLFDSPTLHLWSPRHNQLAIATADGLVHAWDLRKMPPPSLGTSCSAGSPPLWEKTLLCSAQTSLSCFSSHPRLGNLIAW